MSSENSLENKSTLPSISFWAGIWCILLALLFYLEPDTRIFFGFDGSIRYYANYLSSYFPKQLCDAVMPSGPFIFLKWPMHWGKLVSYCIAYEISLRVILGVLIYKIGKLHKSSLLKILIIIGLIQSFGYLDLFIAMLALLWMTYAPRYNHGWQILLAFLLAVGLYIKSTITIPTLAVFGTGLLFYMYEKDWATLKKCFLPFLFFYLGIGVLAYQSILGPFKWLWLQPRLALLSADASNLFSKNKAGLLFTSASCAFAWLFWIRKNRLRLILLLIAPTLFIIWKYATGRQDGSHASAWLLFVLAFTLILWLVAGGREKYMLLGLGLISFVTYKTNFEYSFNTQLSTFRKPSFEPFKKTMAIRNYKMNLKDDLINIQATELDSINQNLLKGKEVGIFPFEFTYAYKYNFKPAFRPGTQSCSYGYTVSKIDSAYWAKSQPEYILWHPIEPNQNEIIWFASIENKHIQNDEWPLIRLIEKNYELLHKDSFHNAVYKRKANQAIPDKVGTQAISSTSFDGAINIPNSDSLILIKAKLQKSLTDKLKTFLYKPDEVIIVYHFSNGLSKQHTISEGALAKGVPANRYYLKNSLQFEPVESIEIKYAQAIKKKLVIKYDLIKID